jgi:DNA-binding CsgD family transcriptional regulator/tetratricopeptide (TPR) repeat protein
VQLLERESELAELRMAVAEAAEQRGSVALVVGEAGIGKSSLVQAWCAEPGADCRILLGLCDDLLTRRTLGPFHDVARRTGGALAAAVAQADTAAVCEAVLDELDHPLRPTVLVLEDVHWADEATLDVVRYIGRRVRTSRGVLVLTYREEEITDDHALRGVLGALATATVRHLRPKPLSVQAIAALTADAGLDPRDVRQLTAGNPFFVTELTHGTTLVPTSVADSVRARLLSLPPDARAAVELLSILPRPVPHGLATALLAGTRVLATAEARGLVEVDEREIRFRHELTRIAILEQLPRATRRQHHAAVLDELVAAGPDPAEVLHHAVLAGQDDLVVRYGLEAAHEAHHAGSHREAVQHQQHVLARHHLLGPDTLARLWEEHAWSLYHLHRFPAAVAAATSAVELRSALDDPAAHAGALCTLSRMHYLNNEPVPAMSAAEQAVALASTTDDREVLAEARLARASLHALLDRPEEAHAEATEVLAAARELGRRDLESLALNYYAVSVDLGQAPTETPRDLLIQAITVAKEGGHLEAAARGYTNLVSVLVSRNDPERWRWYEEAVAFATDHDFPSARYNLAAQGGQQQICEGRWGDAESTFRQLLREVVEPGVLELTALEGLSRLSVRRGAGDTPHLLARAWTLAQQSQAVQYAGPIAAIRAEHAFLTGDAEAAARIRTELDLHRCSPYTRGEILTYLRRTGVDVETAPGEVSDVWAAELAGDLATAVERWSEVGDPYERALTLVRTDDESAVLEALDVLDRLGAEPAARIARQRLRELGVRTIPRGPSARTRDNPAGLTPRQLEIAELLRDGLTNAQIADRLVLSVRTVDHHVAAVLQKLGASSRREAADLLPPVASVASPVAAPSS